MPRKTITKTIVEEPKDAPGVVAYRVGEVEKALKEGFAGLHQKMDELKDGFVSHAQFEEVLSEAQKTHKDYEDRLRSLEKDRNRFKGAVAVLYALAIIIVGLVGALWWTRH